MLWAFAELAGIIQRDNATPSHVSTVDQAPNVKSLHHRHQLLGVVNVRMTDDDAQQRSVQIRRVAKNLFK